jgi:hypothetical protein
MTAIEKFTEQVKIARETGNFVVMTGDEAFTLLKEIFVHLGTAVTLLEKKQ